MRQGFKNVVTAMCGVMLSPLILATRLEARVSRGEGFYLFCAEGLSRISGLPGSYLRRAFYLATVRGCSWSCTIGFGSFFPHRNVTIGERVNIGAYTIIGCAELGDDVMVASRVSITSGRHQHQVIPGVVSRETVLKTVSIGARTWIGEGAIVMANVGSDSIVGAGAVVTNDAPDTSTAMGNPARFVPRPLGEMRG